VKFETMPTEPNCSVGGGEAMNTQTWAALALLELTARKEGFAGVADAARALQQRVAVVENTRRARWN
jgi:hypothetical protein